MPIYDYRCSGCKKTYEYFHSSANDKIPQCPHCGSKHAKKQVSKNTSHILKGKWFKEGY